MLGVNAQLPKVSVIIPSRKGGDISKPYQSILAGNYPLERLEILVAWGQNPSQQRNMAAQKATSDLIYFVDDDVVVPPETIAVAVATMAATAAVVVGGPNLTPIADSNFQKIIGLVLAWKFSHGPMSARYLCAGELRGAGEKELILCNLMVKRARFMAAGGFCHKLYPNEENEFINRLSNSGAKVVYDPEAFVYRSRRPNILAFCKQFFTYGRGRGQQIQQEASYRESLFTLPLIAIFISTCAAIGGNFAAQIAILSYLALAAASLALLPLPEAEATPWQSLALLPLLALIMHNAYGLGLLASMHKSPPPPPGEIEVEQLACNKPGC